MFLCLAREERHFSPSPPFLPILHLPQTSCFLWIFSGVLILHVLAFTSGDSAPKKKKSLLSIIDHYSNTILYNFLKKRKISLYTLSESLPYSYNSKLAKIKKVYLTLGKKKCSILNTLLYKV